MTKTRENNRATHEAIRSANNLLQLHKGCIHYLEEDQVHLSTHIRVLEEEKQKIDTTTEEGRENVRKMEKLISLFCGYIKGSEQTAETVKIYIEKLEKRATELSKDV